MRARWGILLGMMAMAFSLCGIAEGGIRAVRAAETVTRKSVNFNREWKFVRSDIEGAQKENYNDTGWYHVGLPHDFSIPYWQEEKHYTGYGWYRKVFDIKEEWLGKRISLDFAGVFHTAEVYVNGESAGKHEGGYTGFEIDISKYVRAGKNTIAIRVNNKWKADLAPRAGEHNFTGGIYRDVNLVITDPVHISWYGTFVQTPEVSKDGSKVRMQAEVANDGKTARKVKVVNTVYDADKKKISEFSSDEATIPAGETYNFDKTSEYISKVKLWSPEMPNLYSVHTEVLDGGQVIDQYDTTFGFRWYKFDKDKGFFLNGEHYWIDGINAHQDHAGWANAVTTDALKRDVGMIKESGLNFIRGSHYPHSPAYGDACDEYGLLFWSEAPFWCTSAYGEGADNGTSDDYLADGYPTTGKASTERAFEESCITALTEMIRINRNHPSIVVWSMGNEPFFGTNEKKKQNLISKMAGVAKELDPTRCTAMGGTQLGEFDHLPNVDIAGYNGDGAEKPEYQDPQVANLVSEYSSHSGNRPDQYAAFYGSVQTENNEPIRYPWRSGVALWCAFHHGSILSRSYGDMGYVDYYRLPLNIWYYYRYTRTGVEPEFSKKGTATRLSLSATGTTIRNDGTSDTKITVTVVDDAGKWISSEPEVVFEVVDGPGLFPTGKTMKFKPGDSMRDGKAAIEFRSYYAGETTIRAYSPSNPELKEDTIKITTKGEGSTDEPEITELYGAFMSNGGYVPMEVEEPTAYQYHSFKGCPMNASSGRTTAQGAVDGNKSTEWKADKPGSGQWFYLEIEHGGINLYKARFTFNGKVYPFKVQCKKVNISDDEWITVREFDKNAIQQMPMEVDFGGEYMRYIRLEFTDVPEDEFASIAELELYGIRADMDGYKTGMKNLTDISDKAVIDSEKNIVCENNSELLYNLEEQAKGYARVQSDIEITGKKSLSAPVKVAAYCDGELMYEKSIEDADTVASMDISINKVKQLKICVNSEESGVEVKLSNARLIGALRDISKKSASVNTQVCPGMDTLKQGKKLEIQARFENKKSKIVEVAFGMLLHKADGSALAAKIVPVSLPSKGEGVINAEMDIPENIDTLDYVEMVAWDKDTLIPYTENMYIFKESGNVQTKTQADRKDAGLIAAIGEAMQVIYDGKAGEYPLASREGYTDALLKGSEVLNDKARSQEEVDAAEAGIRTVMKELVNGKGTAATPTPAVTQKPDGTEKDNENTADGGSGQRLKKGSTYRVGKFKYKVIKVSAKKVNVALKAPVSRNMKSVSVPAAVNIKGKKCIVTEISARAFANNKKLQKVVVGKNVVKIGKKAFSNDKNLKTVVIKSASLKSVAKNIFSGIKKKPVVKVPAKKYTAYKKIFRGARCIK